MSMITRVLSFAWRGDDLSLAGLSFDVSLLALYLVLAARVRHAGGVWRIWRIACFSAGICVLAVALQSGFARYDEILWVHVTQHQLLMCVAPALLALGAPVVLVLRTVSPAHGRRIVSVLHGPALNWMNRSSAAYFLPLHYFGAMYLYLLTPAYALGQRNVVFHEAAHAYFIACGLMFWTTVLGQLPSPWRPSDRTKSLMVKSGLPCMLALAALLVVIAPVNGTSGVRETLLGAFALALGAFITTAFGLAILRMASGRRRPVLTQARSSPAPDSSRARWRVIAE